MYTEVWTLLVLQSVLVSLDFQTEPLRAPPPQHQTRGDRTERKTISDSRLQGGLLFCLANHTTWATWAKTTEDILPREPSAAKTLPAHGQAMVMGGHQWKAAQDRRNRECFPTPWSMAMRLKGLFVKRNFSTSVSLGADRNEPRALGPLGQLRFPKRPVAERARSLGQTVALRVSDTSLLFCCCLCLRKQFSKEMFHEQRWRILWFLFYHQSCTFCHLPMNWAPKDCLHDQLQSLISQMSLLPYQSHRVR